MLGSILLAAALALVGDVPSKDDGPALRWTWEAAAGCPDEAAVYAEIRRRADELGPTVSIQPISAQGTIRLDPSGEYRLRLKTKVGTVEGEREIVGKDCRELADAAALVLAMLFHPDTAPAEATPPAPPDPPPPPPPTRNTHFGVGLDAVLAQGVLPQTGKGLGLRGFHQRGLWVAELAFTGFLPADASAPILPGATATFQRVESALQLCAATPTNKRLGAAACVGGAVVRLRGRSTGVSDAGAATAYWPEVILAGAAHVAVTPAVRLRLATGFHALGGRPDFAILGLGSVYRPAAYHFRGLLGIDMLF